MSKESILSEDNYYFYAQSLDNSGESSCWVASRSPYVNEVVDSIIICALIRKIDALSNKKINRFGRDCGVCFRGSLRGDCLLTVYPKDLDDSGRFAPVQIVFNAYSVSGNDMSIIIYNTLDTIGRSLSGVQKKYINRYESILNIPKPFLFLFFLFSRGFSFD